MPGMMEPSSTTMTPPRSLRWSFDRVGRSPDGRLAIAGEHVDQATVVIQQRRLNVQAMAKRWEDGLANFECTPEKAQNGKGKESGQGLISAISAQLADLKNRSFGRTRDQVEELVVMLEALENQWKMQEKQMQDEQDNLRQMGQTFVQAAKECGNELALAEQEAAELREEMVQADTELHQRMLESPAAVAASAGAGATVFHSLPVEVELELSGLRHALQTCNEENAALRQQLAKYQSMEPIKEVPGDVMLRGEPTLGGVLEVNAGKTPIDNWQFQWYRLAGDGSAHIIAGAMRPVYAPEPLDLGYIVSCRMQSPFGQEFQATTSLPIASIPGLQEDVHSMLTQGSASFQVIIVRLNSEAYNTRDRYMLCLEPGKIKIKKGKSTKYKEAYSSSMLVCGARGGGDAAAQGMFLALKPSVVLMLVCDNARERNAALMIMRAMAANAGVTIPAPEDTGPQ
eukprot:jgi/Chlat1/5835/Chrsp4S06355